MPKCKLCSYEGRAEIEQAVATHKLSYTAAGKQVGCSKTAIQRHMDRHVSVKVMKAANGIEAREGLDVLNQVIDSHDIVKNIIVNSYNEGDMRTALAAIDTETRQLKLAALVSGQLNEAPQVNIMLDAQYLELQAFIVNALEPYPEARLALSAAFDKVAEDGTNES
jgi:hypothetical protein